MLECRQKQAVGEQFEGGGTIVRHVMCQCHTDSRCISEAVARIIGSWLGLCDTTHEPNGNCGCAGLAWRFFLRGVSLVLLTLKFNLFDRCYRITIR